MTKTSRKINAIIFIKTIYKIKLIKAKTIKIQVIYDSLKFILISIVSTKFAILQLELKKLSRQLSTKYLIILQKFKLILIKRNSLKL